jgi:aconitate decarboxylase
VFPAAIAAAQDVGCNGEEFIAGCVAGYEVANRVGEYLGKQHYHVPRPLSNQLPFFWG